MLKFPHFQGFCRQIILASSKHRSLFSIKQIKTDRIFKKPRLTGTAFYLGMENYFFKWFGGLNLLIITSQTFQISQKFMLSKSHQKQASKQTKQLPFIQTSVNTAPNSNQSIIHETTSLPNTNPLPSYHYPSYDEEQKVIPGYNYLSLFRKKSHIKLSKKKNREESAKRATASKNQPVDRESKNIQKGHWTEQQSSLYHFFLEIHNRHFILKHLRRTDKIFKSMANFMKSRQAEQCRSHHQKMQKKYHNFYQILIKLRMDFYSTLNPEELAQDLEQRGYKVKQNYLISEEQLKNGDLQSKQTKQQRVNPLQSGDDESISQQNDNILSENYEKDLDFNRMHFEP